MSDVRLIRYNFSKSDQICPALRMRIIFAKPRYAIDFDNGLLQHSRNISSLQEEALVKCELKYMGDSHIRPCQLDECRKTTRYEAKNISSLLNSDLLDVDTLTLIAS
jgi:hypothetical protein